MLLNASSVSALSRSDVSTSCSVKPLYTSTCLLLSLETCHSTFTPELDHGRWFTEVELWVFASLWSLCFTELSTWGSQMLQHMAIVHHVISLSETPLCMCHIVCSLVCHGALKFSVMALVKDVQLGVSIALGDPDFSSFLKVLKCKIAWSLVNSVFIFERRSSCLV